MPSERDFKIVSRIQLRFAEFGWQWNETTFSNGDVHIEFTLSVNCNAFSISTNKNYSQDCRYGWGRFQRCDAWTMAENFLLEGNLSRIDGERLREYKERYGHN